MKRRQAFTLIELLVVISIIALLISILLPSLGAARDAAKATACLSGLRQTAIGSHAYTNDHDGWWPLRFRYGVAGTWETLGSGRNVYAMYGSTSPEYGFGALYAGGYVSDSRAMYCQSMEDTGWDFGSAGMPHWAAEPGSAAASTSYRSAYAWNPHLLPDSSEVAYTKVDFHPSDRTLVSDLVINFASAHSERQPSFNIALADGSARVGENSEDVYDYFVLGNRDVRGYGRVIDTYDALEGYGWSRDAQPAAR